MSGLHYRQQVLTWSNKYVVYSVTHSITYRESQVELWTPTAGYTAPSLSPPDGWASRWLNNTPFLFSEYLCPGLRCCSPGCRSPGPWGQDRTRVPQILPGQKMWYLTFNVFIINNFIKFAYLCLTSDIKRSSEKSYLTYYYDMCPWESLINWLWVYIYIYIYRERERERTVTCMVR